VEGTLQAANVGNTEAPTEVAGRGGIGDAACAEGVEECLVVATQLDVFGSSD
jgi:hypothetical protein